MEATSMEQKLARLEGQVVALEGCVDQLAIMASRTNPRLLEALRDNLAGVAEVASQEQDARLDPFSEGIRQTLKGRISAIEKTLYGQLDT